MKDEALLEKLRKSSMETQHEKEMLQKQVVHGSQVGASGSVNEPVSQQVKQVSPRRTEHRVHFRKDKIWKRLTAEGRKFLPLGLYISNILRIFPDIIRDLQLNRIMPRIPKIEKSVAIDPLFTPPPPPPSLPLIKSTDLVHSPCASDNHQNHSRHVPDKPALPTPVRSLLAPCTHLPAHMLPLAR
ncbi:hypothetical protein RND71_032121 [Anisodus tanguticus]|uniref:Uncharacterized protein n=1 Tax=Anisodus tanguticus TaxID=243964 RepID=A0AAE1RCL6_9SOLA|nr:hypothetical protein RND71_032121 [Anisodus tanguticus]